MTADVWASRLSVLFQFGLTGRREEGLAFRTAVLLCVPMAVDGLTQAFGWRESLWLWRTFSGSLFSLGIA